MGKMLQGSLRAHLCMPNPFMHAAMLHHDVMHCMRNGVHSQAGILPVFEIVRDAINCRSHIIVDNVAAVHSSKVK